MNATESNMNVTAAELVKNAKRQGGGGSGEGAAAGGLSGMWLEGWRVFGRFLGFVFFLMVLMVPWGIASQYVNPRSLPLFGADGFHVEAAVTLVGIVIYLPFAAFYAARWSNQLRGKQARRG